MKRKMIWIPILCLAVFVILWLLNDKDPRQNPKQETRQEEQQLAKKTKEKVSRQIGVSVNLSGLETVGQWDPFVMQTAIEKYLRDENLSAKKVTALDYRYEDLETADTVYDIYFLLDDEEETLLTMVYDLSDKRSVKIRPCEYRLEEIQEQVWYKEEIQ